MDKNKVKAILRWAFGAALSVLSLLLIVSFLLYCFTPRRYDQPAMNAAGVISMWLAILGAGIPGGLLLRRAILDTKNKKIEDAEEDSDDEE